MPRITIGRVVTAFALLYSALLVFFYFLPGTGGGDGRQVALAELAGPSFYLLKPLGLHVDHDGTNRSVESALLVLGLFQALAVWGLARWRTRPWRKTVGEHVREFSHGPAVFRVAATYAALVFTVAVWVLYEASTTDGSMAGVWLFPLLGPAILPLFVFDVDFVGYMTFASPVQAWVFWRLLRGRRVAGATG
ncbi:SCO4225 family membrane protein [Actinomadura rupiterrae]|uniref:SCO4225 family membrane protein n=1 Tax=Actinomadura rupiterrae TaxID=559627 RepID=UPI0020A59E59|nr:hypothetical protein [Actinomadura rupiterrae]MCP2337670.1 hypothetical protein [Actinomadura rupiterrae]